MIINMTPHTINIYSNKDDDFPQVVIPASGEVARVSVARAPAFRIKEELGHEVQVFETAYGEVVGLPEEEHGVYLIVSGMVRSALPSRLDLLSPGELVRNSDGTPIGCIGLTR